LAGTLENVKVLDADLADLGEVGLTTVALRVAFGDSSSTDADDVPAPSPSPSSSSSWRGRSSDGAARRRLDML